MLKRIKEFIRQKVSIDALLIAGLSIILLLCSMRSIELPGLYMDAVNPDYISTGMVYKDYPNICWLLPYIGIPLITQLYHGTVTLLVGTPLFMIFGASIESLRIINSIYGLLAVIILYYIVKIVTNGNRGIAFGTAICIATNVALLSSFRTQLYILIPGTVFFLGAIYTLLSEAKTPWKRVLLSGVLSGLAFYSYFVYLFYVPAFLALVWYRHRENLFINIGKWLWGFIIGSSFYVFAYFSMGISFLGLSKGTELLCLIGFIALWAAFVGVPFYYFYQNKMLIGKARRNYCIYVFISAVLTLSSGLYIMINGTLIREIDYLKNVLNSLNIIREPQPLLKRLYFSVNYIIGILQNKTNEINIFSKPISIFTWIYTALFFVMTLYSFYIILKFKGKYKITGEKLFIFFLFIFSFIVSCIPFISRMGGHHFVSILFLIFIIIGIETYVISDYFNTIRQRFNLSKKMVGILLALLIVLNFVNQGIFFEYLQRTGGVGKYTEQLNLLAENAVQNKRSGQSETYIFPEWGFMMSFNFLTRNSIPYILEINEHTVRPIKDEGNKAVLCYWSKNDSQKYIEQLQKYGMIIIYNSPCYTRNGQIAFYKIIAQ